MAESLLCRQFHHLQKWIRYTLYQLYIDPNQTVMEASCSCSFSSPSSSHSSQSSLLSSSSSLSLFTTASTPSKDLSMNDSRTKSISGSSSMTTSNSNTHGQSHSSGSGNVSGSDSHSASVTANASSSLATSSSALSCSSLLLPPSGSLMVNVGIDFSALNKLQIASFIAIDSSATQLQQAQQKYAARAYTFPAQFHCFDLSQSSNPPRVEASGSPIVSPVYPIPPLSISTIFSFDSLHHVWTSPAAAASYFHYLSSSLKVGGMVIGTSFDPATIFSKVQKAAEKDALSGSSTVTTTVSTDLYKLSWPLDFSCDAEFGSSFLLTLTDSASFTGYLISLSQFLDLSSAAGFEFVHMTNALDWYHEHCGAFGQELAGMGVVDGEKGKLPGAVMELIGMWSVWALVKAKEPDRDNLDGSS